MSWFQCTVVVVAMGAVAPIKNRCTGAGAECYLEAAPRALRHALAITTHVAVCFQAAQTTKTISESGEEEDVPIEVGAQCAREALLQHTSCTVF